jgi:hypothetical protein
MRGEGRREYRPRARPRNPLNGGAPGPRESTQSDHPTRAFHTTRNQDHTARARPRFPPVAVLVHGSLRRRSPLHPRGDGGLAGGRKAIGDDLDMVDDDPGRQPAGPGRRPHRWAGHAGRHGRVLAGRVRWDGAGRVVLPGRARGSRLARPGAWSSHGVSWWLQPPVWISFPSTTPVQEEELDATPSTAERCRRLPFR